MKKMIKTVDEIKKNLVLKTILFLDSSYRENSNDISNEGETFTITIKVGNKKVLTTIFPSTQRPARMILHSFISAHWKCSQSINRGRKLF